LLSPRAVEVGPRARAGVVTAAITTTRRASQRRVWLLRWDVARLVVVAAAAVIVAALAVVVVATALIVVATPMVVAAPLMAAAAIVALSVGGRRRYSYSAQCGERRYECVLHQGLPVRPVGHTLAILSIDRAA